MQTLTHTIAEKISSANSDSAISTREQRKEAVKGLADKYATNPSGLLMYHPAGRPFMLGKGLGIEFATDRSRRFPLLFRFRFCAFQSRGLPISLQFMHTKLLALFLAIGLAGTCMVNAQSPSPTASPSPAKHRSHKKADATKAAAPAATSNASPAEGTAASPSPAEKRTRKTKKTAAAATSPSPAAATTASPSPAAEHGR